MKILRGYIEEGESLAQAIARIATLAGQNDVDSYEIYCRCGIVIGTGRCECVCIKNDNVDSTMTHSENPWIKALRLIAEWPSGYEEIMCPQIQAFARFALEFPGRMAEVEQWIDHSPENNYKFEYVLKQIIGDWERGTDNFGKTSKKEE